MILNNSSINKTSTVFFLGANGKYNRSREKQTIMRILNEEYQTENPTEIKQEKSISALIRKKMRTNPYFKEIDNIMENYSQNRIGTEVFSRNICDQTKKIVYIATQSFDSRGFQEKYSAEINWLLDLEEICIKFLKKDASKEEIIEYLKK